MGTSIEPYFPGDLVLSGPYLPHCWRNDGAVAKEPSEWIAIQFAASSWGSDFIDLPECLPLQSLLARAKDGLAFNAHVSAQIIPFLRDLCRSQGLVQLLRLGEVLHSLTEVEGRSLGAASASNTASMGNGRADALNRIMRYISERFRGPVHQAELATELHMSPATLSKFVRSCTGTTFSDLVKQARINEASRLLAHSDDRITDIALDCGYAHTSHFDHHFQELKGVTPSEYRRCMSNLALNRKNSTISQENEA